jgi:chromosome segregation ATPase
MKRAEIEREDVEGRLNRLSRDYNQLLQALEEKDYALNELSASLESERVRCEGLEQEFAEQRNQFDHELYAVKEQTRVNLERIKEGAYD